MKRSSKRLDGHVDRLPQRGQEPLRSPPPARPARRAASAAGRRRPARRPPRRRAPPAGGARPRLAGSLDDADGPRKRPVASETAHAGPRGAVVQGQAPSLASAARTLCSACATASVRRSGFLPPARAIVGRPPPPPPIIAAASRIDLARVQPAALERLVEVDDELRRAVGARADDHGRRGVLAPSAGRRRRADRRSSRRRRARSRRRPASRA